MLQIFSLKYYCRNYCMEILHFCIKIGITLHECELGVSRGIYLVNYNYNG